MTRVVGAELLKLRTTRTFWGLAASAVGLVLVVTVLSLAFGHSFRDEDDVRSLLSFGGASGLLLLVMGVVFSAGEYRHGTIASTLLVTPDRLRVVAAQALACVLAGLAVGLVTAGAVAAVALPWLAAKNAPTLSAGALLGLFGGGTLYAGLAAALGAGAGAVLRNQVLAVVLVLVIVFVVDPSLAALISDYSKYSLNGLGIAMSGGTSEDLGSKLLPVWLAALVWGGYTLFLVGLAALLTSRRDV